MEPKYDVIAMGELLIDFTENGYSEQGNHILEANPGGAPCNVLAMLNRLGKKTSFLGMVGKDQFGVLLRDTLKELGIDTSHLYESEKVHTTLAFVHTLEDGDREFAFYRNPGADMMLKEEHVEVEFVRSAKAFHYGTLSMTHEDVRKATVYAIRAAKEAGLLLSFDPNLRPPLWSDMEEARAQIQYGLSQCDLLKNFRRRTGICNRNYGCDPGSQTVKEAVSEYPSDECDDGKRRKYGISSGQTSILQTVFTERND